MLSSAVQGGFWRERQQDLLRETKRASKSGWCQGPCPERVEGHSGHQLRRMEGQVLVGQGLGFGHVQPETPSGHSRGDIGPRFRQEVWTEHTDSAASALRGLSPGQDDDVPEECV